jgi:hypothetical protein
MRKLLTPKITVLPRPKPIPAVTTSVAEKLPPEEWDFSQLESDELQAARDYEFGREVVLLEKPYRQQAEG